MLDTKVEEAAAPVQAPPGDLLVRGHLRLIWFSPEVPKRRAQKRTCMLCRGKSRKMWELFNRPGKFMCWSALECVERITGLPSE